MLILHRAVRNLESILGVSGGTRQGKPWTECQECQPIVKYEILTQTYTTIHTLWMSTHGWTGGGNRSTCANFAYTQQRRESNQSPKGQDKHRQDHPLQWTDVILSSSSLLLVRWIFIQTFHLKKPQRLSSTHPFFFPVQYIIFKVSDLLDSFKL